VENELRVKKIDNGYLICSYSYSDDGPPKDEEVFVKEAGDLGEKVEAYFSKSKDKPDKSKRNKGLAVTIAMGKNKK